MQSQQNPYQAPNAQQSSVQQAFAQSQNPPVVKIGEWVWSIILIVIPLVNIIALIVWAASSATNPNKKNFAIAQLILMGIFMVLYILLIIVAVGAGGFRF